jgi:hypothetical protein
VEFIGHRPARLRVPALELSTSQARAPSHRTTRATQKVKEAEPMWSKSKGKGKVKINDELLEEALICHRHCIHG